MSEPIARLTRLMRLCPDVSVVAADDGQIVLTQGSRLSERLGSLTDKEIAALRALAAGELAESELTARLGHASSLTHRLLAGGWLTVAYGHSGRPLVTIRPLGPRQDPPPTPPAVPRLSRFAVLRREGDALLLESPLAKAAVMVHDTEVVALIHHLTGSGGRPPRVGLAPEIVAELVAELARHGFLHEADEEPRSDLAPEQWSPHELWFHARSRAEQPPPGGQPAPARRSAWPGPAVALPTPDVSPGTTFGTVLEARPNVRDAGPAPLTLAQLGAFLHWTAKSLAHGLEIYPVVAGVSGLAPGVYHYDAFGHLLEPVPTPEPATGRLIARAASAAGGAVRPPVLLVITARFGPGAAYTLILRDLGALLQTMYLVATSMDLAPLAIGAGDADVFAAATGLDQLVEASVGEFLLSSRTK